MKIFTKVAFGTIGTLSMIMLGNKFQDNQRRSLETNHDLPLPPLEKRISDSLPSQNTKNLFLLGAASSQWLELAILLPKIKSSHPFFHTLGILGLFLVNEKTYQEAVIPPKHDSNILNKVEETIRTALPMTAREYMGLTAAIIAKESAVCCSRGMILRNRALGLLAFYPSSAITQHYLNEQLTETFGLGALGETVIDTIGDWFLAVGTIVCLNSNGIKGVFCTQTKINFPILLISLLGDFMARWKLLYCIKEEQKERHF